MEHDGIPHAGLSTDAEFLRRVHLDLTGRLPEPAAVRKFLADTDPAKREKIIDALLATPYRGNLDKPETPFLDKWTYFFGDLFRNSAGELGARGRNLLRDYIYSALLLNVPYNEVVRELLTARTRDNFVDARGQLPVARSRGRFQRPLCQPDGFLRRDGHQHQANIFWV